MRRSAVPAELSALSPGDLVVHVDHGIGRFEGLKTIVMPTFNVGYEAF